MARSRVNAGTYRVLVHDKNTLCVFIEPGKHGDVIRKKYWAAGTHCPMVVTVGQAPVLGAVAASTAAEGVSEFAIAGARLGRPVELLDGKHTGLPFPADAEIVFEGTMPPPEEVSVAEGPFGEWPGYYASNSRPEPVLQIKAVYHRDDPIIVGAPPVRPVLPGFWYGTGGSAHFRAASLWDELEAAGVPGIKGVWTLPGGGPRFIRVVAIEQLHAGHAKMAGLVAAGAGRIDMQAPGIDHPRAFRNRNIASHRRNPSTLHHHHARFYRITSQRVYRRTLDYNG